MANKLRVVVAGATGWAGSAVARGVARSADLSLTAAVARRNAGRALGDVLGAADAGLAAPIEATAEAALAHGCDVFVEFTKPDAAKANVLAALARGAHVVVGTSGLTDADYADVDRAAREHKRGVLACGNFALTAVLLMKFGEIAARYLDHFELLDYAHEDKPDVPSGTVREFAARLARVREAAQPLPLEKLRGPKETRGARVGAVQVHSVRLPGYVLGVEAIFGAAGQRLHLKHEAGASAEPYVDGALLAIRKVGTLVGVTRGLDQVMTW
jgi:4-hydroxy-tetrahydrodipicolinate reductase